MGWHSTPPTDRFSSGHGQGYTTPVDAPPILYGTAWKEERTQELTALALGLGFRGIDTANQRKHYAEAAVGAAVRGSRLARPELFLQTKFTYARGQDHRLPYDARAPIAHQVRQSFESSLSHLGTDHIDSLLLHGPWAREGLSAEDREAWQAMEALFREGQVRYLGISNVSREQLELLCERATVAPSFVQNRCYAHSGWDGVVRAFCQEHGIVYQGFSLLTANRDELARSSVTEVARRLDVTIPELVFAFARAVGMLPLTGTTDDTHMRQDLASISLELAPSDVEVLLQMSGHSG